MTFYQQMFFNFFFEFQLEFRILKHVVVGFQAIPKFLKCYIDLVFCKKKTKIYVVVKKTQRNFIFFNPKTEDKKIIHLYITCIISVIN